MHARTAAANQIRGLLAEYGIILPKQVQNIRNYLPGILANTKNEKPLCKVKFAV